MAPRPHVDDQEAWNRASQWNAAVDQLLSDHVLATWLDRNGINALG
jgi:hypothetical protein